MTTNAYFVVVFQVLKFKFKVFFIKTKLSILVIKLMFLYNLSILTFKTFQVIREAKVALKAITNLGYSI